MTLVMWCVAMWIGQMFDVATTAHLLRLGCIEANPLLPAHIEGIFLVKVTACIFLTGLGIFAKDRGLAFRVFLIGAILGVLPGFYNLSIAGLCPGR